MSIKTTMALWLSLAMLTLAGCASAPVHYVSTDVDFSFIRSAAVVPFQNLSSDRFAAQRMESVFLSELLSYDGLDIIDPGEVLKAWSDLRFRANAVLSADQVMALGERLGVDAIFTGSVEEYGLERLGGNKTYTITAVFGLAETTSGSVIWSAQVNTDGSSLWQKLFGGQPTSLYKVSRDAIRQALDTLLDPSGDSSGRQDRDSSR